MWTLKGKTGGYRSVIYEVSTRSGKSVVIRTSTRQTIYLPVPGLIDTQELVPGELVGTNKDSYLILEKLPAEYDSRVKVFT